MTDPRFLDLAEVLEIHRDQIERYGGDPVLRDLGLLQSALAMPAAGYAGVLMHEDPFEMAAAYLFHIVRNHPFIDGNKRTGAVAALVFLLLNGYALNVPEDALAETVLAVAAGRIPKSDVASFFRQGAHPQGEGRSGG